MMQGACCIFSNYMYSTADIWGFAPTGIPKIYWWWQIKNRTTLFKKSLEEFWDDTSHSVTTELKICVPAVIPGRFKLFQQVLQVSVTLWFYRKTFFHYDVIRRACLSESLVMVSTAEHLLTIGTWPVGDQACQLVTVLWGQHTPNLKSFLTEPPLTCTHVKFLVENVTSSDMC